MALQIDESMTGPLDLPGFAPTGRKVEFETTEFSHLDGHVLAHHTVVLNMLALARQIGGRPVRGEPCRKCWRWLQRLSAGRAGRRRG